MNAPPKMPTPGGNRASGEAGKQTSLDCTAFRVEVIKQNRTRVVYGHYADRKKALTVAATLCAYGIAAELVDLQQELDVGASR